MFIKEVLSSAMGEGLFCSRATQPPQQDDPFDSFDVVTCKGTTVVQGRSNWSGQSGTCLTTF